LLFSLEGMMLLSYFRRLTSSARCQKANCQFEPVFLYLVLYSGS
jgi:hypothetical protein